MRPERDTPHGFTVYQDQARHIPHLLNLKAPLRAKDSLIPQEENLPEVRGYQYDQESPAQIGRH